MPGCRARRAGAGGGGGRAPAKSSLSREELLSEAPTTASRRRTQETYLRASIPATNTFSLPGAPDPGAGVGAPRRRRGATRAPGTRRYGPRLSSAYGPEHRGEVYMPTGGAMRPAAGRPAAQSRAAGHRRLTGDSPPRVAPWLCRRLRPLSLRESGLSPQKAERRGRPTATGPAGLTTDVLFECARTTGGIATPSSDSGVTSATVQVESLAA